eukprot:Hpha_TRINITY_DN20707_c0_g1::TRINITY_DN20707_c0_g1_i1::g.33356::m.33356
MRRGMLCITLTVAVVTGQEDDPPICPPCWTPVPETPAPADAAFDYPLPQTQPGGRHLLQNLDTRPCGCPCESFAQCDPSCGCQPNSDGSFVCGGGSTPLPSTCPTPPPTPAPTPAPPPDKFPCGCPCAMYSQCDMDLCRCQPDSDVGFFVCGGKYDPSADCPATPAPPTEKPTPLPTPEPPTPPPTPHP